jgi:hypothetical protein
MYGEAKRRLETEGHKIASIEAAADIKEERDIIETR